MHQHMLPLLCPAIHVLATSTRDAVAVRLQHHYCRYIAPSAQLWCGSNDATVMQPSAIMALRLSSVCCPKYTILVLMSSIISQAATGSGLAPTIGNAYLLVADVYG